LDQQQSWLEEVEVSPEHIVVFLLAENCLLREALLRVLRKKDDIVVAGAIPFSPSALEMVSAANPNVVLFDSASIALTGPRLVSQMRQAGGNHKSVMVGMEEDEAVFLRAVGEGVVGYVLKDASAADIIRVIRAVAAGEAVCPPRFSLSLFQCAARGICFALEPPQKTKFGLSRREQQLVGLIRLGLSNKEIGSRLNLSEQTVKNHIHRMLRKVGANDRLEILERCQSTEFGSGNPASIYLSGPNATPSAQET
jgi:two-component system response regulator DevR